MKRCPFCAEEIQDEAVFCRFCKRGLAAPAGQMPSPPAWPSPGFPLATMRKAGPSPGLMIILIAAVAYCVVVFFPWEKACLSGFSFPAVCASRNGFRTFAIIAFLLCLLLALGAVLAMSGVSGPISPKASGAIDFGLACAVAVLTVARVATDHEYLAYGAWLGILAAAVLVVGGVLRLVEGNKAGPPS